jgi:hypothetical protein
MHNVIESSDNNSEILAYLKGFLGLGDGDYNIIYAIKNTIGE